MADQSIAEPIDPRHGGTSPVPATRCHTRFGVFPECPLCGGALTPEHAHFKCFSCGWRDSCCD